MPLDGSKFSSYGSIFWFRAFLTRRLCLQRITMGDNSSPRRRSHLISDFNCCREYNARATILDLMELKTSEAGDREKR